MAVHARRSGLRYGDALWTDERVAEYLAARSGLPAREWMESIRGYGYEPRHRAVGTHEHSPTSCLDCDAAARYQGRHRAEG